MDKSQLAEDISFMRKMVERTQRRIDPGAPLMITWGMICLIGFPVSHILLVRGMGARIPWMWGGLLVIGFVLSFLFHFRRRRKEQARGASSYMSGQIAWVWTLLWPNGLLWSALGMFEDPLGTPSFMWAALYGIGLSMMGLLYSKEWLVSGLAVFIAIPIAWQLIDVAFIILGVVMGLGCIVPGIIALCRLRRWEAEDATA